MANQDDKNPEAKDADKPAVDEAAAAKKRERAEKAKAAGEKKKKATEPAGPAPKYKREKPPRLRAKYEETVRPQMMKEFSYSTIMQVPRILKVTVNMGLGKAKDEPKMIDNGVEELKQITGQSPVVSRAKKDIAVFKLRKGQKIGVMVTLRRERMWEFLDRLLNIALPRVRDFRGISPRGFDGRGNFTMGVREQIIFPEIEYDKIDSIKGLNISIVTTAETDAEGRALLAHLGMPFRASTPTGAPVPGAAV
jgi:large subunit ribosomal protein L5